jgi:DNA-binding transcriptional LysR family regulator
MELAEFDLNLLRVLDAVLAERSVTRAAKRLHLSQPAVSHSLRKLRATFGDPLIERVGRTMRITVEGRRLQSEVTEILRRVQVIVGPADFDPSRTERRFAVAIPDPLGVRIGPILMRAFRASAPLALLEVQRLHSIRTPAQLDDGGLDAAISITGSLDPHLRSSPLLTVDWRPVVARRSSEPRTALPMTLDELVARPHAIVTRPPGTGRAPRRRSELVCIWTRAELVQGQHLLTDPLCADSAPGNGCKPAREPAICAARGDASETDQ